MYRYKLPVAKIELLSLDIARVEYKSDKSESTPKNIKPDSRVLELQEAANKRARERRAKKEWQEIKLSDLPNTNNTDNG